MLSDIFITNIFKSIAHKKHRVYNKRNRDYINRKYNNDEISEKYNRDFIKSGTWTKLDLWNETGKGGIH